MATPPTILMPSAEAQIDGVIFGILLVSPDGLIRQINPAAQEFLGLSAPRTIGRPVFECIRLRDDVMQSRLLASDEGLTIRDVALDGVFAPHGINITSSRLDGEGGWRVLTLSQASPSRETDLPAATLRGPAILAHEIKNPLAAIKGAGQLLIRNSGQDDTALAQLIVGEADRIAKLIDRMQSLGSTHAKPAAPCNQHEAIRSAIAAIRSGLGAGIDIAEEFDPSLPYVLANRDLLEQVLLNLLGNACEAVQASRPEIWVETRYCAAPLMMTDSQGVPRKLSVEISVVDNGPGVDPALEEQIFEPFVSTKGGGHGLGLPLVRKLMRDMGGRVTYQRRADRTYFRLHLPTVPANSEDLTS